MSKKRNRRIAIQINRPLIILEFVFILFSSLFLFLYTMSHYLRERFEYTKQLGHNMALELESYKPLSFLVPYWQEHYSEMEFFYGDEKKLDEKETRLYQIAPDLPDARYVSSERAATLNNESQMLLAEICYYELSEIYNRHKQAYGPEFLTGFVVKDNESFFLLTGIKDNEARISSGGEVFELGSTSPYVEGMYPILDELVQTGESPSSMEFSMSKGADSHFVHIFVPVMEGSRTLMYVGVSMQWRDMISDVISISLLMALVTALLFLIIGLMFQRLLTKYVTTPIKQENDIINEYKVSKDSAKTTEALSYINSGNEIQELAEDFSSMTVELEQHIADVRSITAEKERIGAELDMAKQIQEGQLPSTFPAFPECEQFEIYATMTPAKEVGGDFYDFFFVDDDHLAMVIADVSGKGVPAALFMMMSKILINNYAMMGLSPAEVLERTNNTICKNNKQKMFVTVWLGIMDIRSGRIVAANAGHEYPVIKQPDGEFELFKEKHGFVIGAKKNIKCKEYEFTLEKGGTLFVYTDGVPEATNADEELYGTDRLVEELNRHPDAGPEELLPAVHKDVDRFVGDAPQFDDLTMLAIKLKSETGGKQQ